MIPLKKVEAYFNRKNDGHSLTCWRAENGQSLVVKACVVGDNFYDYGETPKPIRYNYAPWAENDPRIIVISCEECCGCAGW